MLWGAAKKKPNVADDAPGQPRWGVAVPEADVREALAELIAGRQ